MFRVQSTETGKNYRLAVVGLLLLSAAALAVTIWEMIDFLREQAIVEDLMQRLPEDARDSAEILAGELWWQSRLTILVVLNVVVTGIALILLWRAYRSSQESLRDLRALAGDVLSSMDQAVLTTDRSGTITSINRRGLEFLEESRDGDCVGRNVSDLKSIPLGEFRSDWLAQRSASMTRDMQVHRDGHTRVLRAFCQTLNDHAGNEIGNVLQLRDVSERVLIEDRMRRMERYMGLGSLAGGLHHEIKNPLAALSLHVQLLEEELEGDNPSDEVRQMLGVIRTEVTRIGGVLEGFRDFASIGQLNLTPVELNELIRGQVSLVQPSATQASIRIDFEHEGDECFVLADRVRLEQVLLNLVVNAMEAMPDGGTITITTRESGEFAVIEVRDTGVGIPENLKDRILDPYFTTKSEGTGLGLALCDKVLRQHRGSLEFQSSERGTVFVLTIPKAQVESSQGS